MDRGEDVYAAGIQTATGIYFNRHKSMLNKAYFYVSLGCTYKCVAASFMILYRTISSVFVFGPPPKGN